LPHRCKRGKLCTASGTKPAGKHHIVKRAQVGNQVELLENHTHMIGAKTVARCRRHAPEAMPKQADVAFRGSHQAGNQRKQGTLAATARSTDQQLFASLHLPARKIDQGIVLGPGELEAFQVN